MVGAEMWGYPKTWILTLVIFCTLVLVSGTNNDNTLQYSPGPRSSYDQGRSNYYTPGIYNPGKSYYSPPLTRTKGDATYGGSYSYRNYNTIPAASTVNNNYKGFQTTAHGYYQATQAYNRPTAGYLQGRASKNNWQDNYRFTSGVQDARSRWSHSPPLAVPANYRTYGGFGDKAGLGYNLSPLRDNRQYSGTRIGQLPNYALSTGKKTGVYVIPTPSKLYHDGVKN